jgi:hypothetical protein
MHALALEVIRSGAPPVLTLLVVLSACDRMWNEPLEDGPPVALVFQAIVAAAPKVGAIVVEGMRARSVAMRRPVRGWGSPAPGGEIPRPLTGGTAR